MQRGEQDKVIKEKPSWLQNTLELNIGFINKTLLKHLLCARQYLKYSSQDDLWNKYYYYHHVVCDMEDKRSNLPKAVQLGPSRASI